MYQYPLDQHHTTILLANMLNTDMYSFKYHHIHDNLTTSHSPLTPPPSHLHSTTHVVHYLVTHQVQVHPD